MEKRIANIIIQNPGGTASKASSSYKVALPSTWVNQLGVNADNRQLLLSFDGTTITISKVISFEKFIETKRQAGHKLLLLSYYDGDTLCSQIAADDTDQTLCTKDFVSDFLKTAFGNNQLPTWEDYLHFLEDRCIPHARAGLREYLETLDLEEYDPLEIIKKTSGRMAEDDQWIRLEGVK